MTQDYPKIDSKYYRFGEQTVQMNFAIPDTLKQAVKGEARDRNVSASRFITDLLIERLKKTNPAIKELHGRERV
jgi:hypothetical protein